MNDVSRRAAESAKHTSLLLVCAIRMGAASAAMQPLCPLRLCVRKKGTLREKTKTQSKAIYQ